MRSERTSIHVVLATAALLLLTLQTPAAAAGKPIFGSELSGDTAHMSAQRAEEAANRNKAIPEELREFDYERSPYCREVAGIWVRGSPTGPARAVRTWPVPPCSARTATPS